MENARYELSNELSKNFCIVLPCETPNLVVPVLATAPALQLMLEFLWRNARGLLESEAFLNERDHISYGPDRLTHVRVEAEAE